MFQSLSKNAFIEIEGRKKARENLLSFGIQFLDDAMIGISPNDLILIGAPSGVGKTQLCTQIALQNLLKCKRVHYFALEAEQYEIERRIKFQMIAEMFYKDPDRPKIANFNFDRWNLGYFIDDMETYEQTAAEFMESGFKELFVFYKLNRFGTEEMTEQVILNAHQSDLMIVDHVHYFDFDDDNENRAIKKIAKTARELALEQGKPIILVSHLRKRDRNNSDLCAGLDEFHGTSDLYKIATKVITVASGSQTDRGTFETFMRIPKNRMNGGVTRYIGRLIFNPKGNAYEKSYKIGWANCTRDKGFEELDGYLYPEWARRS